MHLAKHQRRPRLALKLRHHPGHARRAYLGNLLALYRESENPFERARWHAIWLLFGAPAPQMNRFGAPAPQMNRATGHSIPEVAQTLGYSTRWVRDTLHR
jgi:hypothetical protein